MHSLGSKTVPAATAGSQPPEAASQSCPPPQFRKAKGAATARGHTRGDFFSPIVLKPKSKLDWMNENPHVSKLFFDFDFLIVLIMGRPAAKGSVDAAHVEGTGLLHTYDRQPIEFGANSPCLPRARYANLRPR